jgi:GTP cyclohydrolase II
MELPEMHVPTRVIRPQSLSSIATSTDSTRTEAKWIASAPLPTRHGSFEAHVFHAIEDGIDKEHVALVYGDIAGHSRVAVRVHSECMTSEVFGSLKCDCKEQLDTAMAEIARRGSGAIVYLRQEGRGIGLANKIRAYELQSHGYDTVDANRELGLPDDARRYDAARDMLSHFDVDSILLLTNNHEKVNALRALGMNVEARLPIVISPNPYSSGYLDAKRDRMAHALPLTWNETIGDAE